MRIRTIPFHLIIFLLLYSLTLPAVACPPPDCGDCCHWEGPVPGGSCQLNTGAECGDCAGCSGECKSCNSCSCEDDNSKCGGECGNCVNGVCDGCNANNCEECKFGLCVTRCDFTKCEACNGSGTCVYQCTACQICSSPICVDCDTDYTSLCSWTYPPVQSGCPGQTVDDLSCHPLDIGKSCHWVITDIIQLWNDACPCCTLDTTSCVELTPWKCGNEFKITLGWVCHCDSESIGTPANRGSGTKCPE